MDSRKTTAFFAERNEKMLAPIYLAAAAVLLSTRPAAMPVERPDACTGVSLDKWIAREAGWHIEEGTARHADPFFHGGILALSPCWVADLRLEAEAHITKVYHDPDSVWAGLLLRAPGALVNGPWGGGYHLFIRADGTVELHAQHAGELRHLTTEWRPREGFVRLAVEADGSRLRCYVNDELLINTNCDAYAAGEVALTHFGNETVFRNISVAAGPVERSAPKPVTPDQPEPLRHPPVEPLPAIGVRSTDTGTAVFYKRDTGERFVPKGFNHTILEHDATGWHATFNVGIYDAERMEDTLTAMADAGGNTIRVWAWGVQNETGFTGASDSHGLNGAYMENFTDFLRRATRHGIYVIPILDETPRNAYYDSVSESYEAEAKAYNISGYNVNYLSPGPLAAKKAAAAHFVRYVKQADEGLLNTVLGWSFANEIFVNHTNAPFYRKEGKTITSTGRSYDMADREQRQACYDETILHWVNTLAGAVKDVAPGALTTVGMWTSDAHGRPPENFLLPDDKDPRIPPRPSILAGADSDLDFLDIHIYPWDGTSKVRPDAHEWEQVRKSGKPVVVGEYGVFKDKSIEEAREIMREMLEQSADMGYQGALHWVWDLTRVAGQTWSSVEEGLAVFLMSLEIPWRE